VKRVLTAVILIPVVVLALFLAPLWLFTLLVLGVALLAAREYFDIAAATGFTPFRKLSYAIITGLLIECYLLKLLNSLVRDSWHLGSVPLMETVVEPMIIAICIFLLASPLIFLAVAMRRDPLSRALPDAAVSWMSFPYVGCTLACLVILRQNQVWALYLLLAMLIVWTGDVAAFYVGRAIGTHKMAPRVSPGKTWEGAAASVFAAMAMGWLLFCFFPEIASFFTKIHLIHGFFYPNYSLRSPNVVSRVPWWFALLFAVSLNIAAQCGDLVESALKRGAGIKDSGTLLPGHGGVLDRIDALLFALPVMLLFHQDIGRFLPFPGNA
jgi:phosphatidate cytidylyltransferase